MRSCRDTHKAIRGEVVCGSLPGRHVCKQFYTVVLVFLLLLLMQYMTLLAKFKRMGKLAEAGTKTLQL